MAPAAPLRIEKSPWFDEQPGSPSLPEDQFSVDFALLPAESDDGPTVALLGAYRIPGRYAELYGGKTFGALRIVAIDIATGGAHHNDALRADSAPLSDYLRSHKPEPPSEGVTRLSASSHFNVDLRQQLALPPHGATYAVFVWFDEMVSPVRVARMPGEPPAEGAGAVEPLRPRGLRFGPGQPAGNKMLSLAAEVQGEGKRADEVAVTGGVAPAAVAGAARPLLVVLAKAAVSRKVTARCADLPEGAAGGPVGFQFTLDWLIDPADWPQRYFLTAWAGKALAWPAVVDAEPEAAD